MGYKRKIYILSFTVLAMFFSVRVLTLLAARGIEHFPAEKRQG